MTHEQPVDMSLLTVATYNVNCDCTQSSENYEVLATIARVDSDVVCLQEVNSDWEELVRSTQTILNAYPFIQFHTIAKNRWGGFAVLSKLPIEEFTVLPELDPCWYPAGRIIVKSRDSVSVQICNVHLRAPVRLSFPKPFWWGGHADFLGGFFSKAVRMRRRDEIESFMKQLHRDLPTIVLGDFNERRSGGCLRYLKERWEMLPVEKQACPSIAHSYWPLCNRTNSWCWKVSGTLPLLSFDYDYLCYHPKDFDVSLATVHADRALASDHFMVSASFRIKSGRD